jgi:hypothetical protein
MISPENIHAYFEDNHGPLVRSTKGWYTGECPFCGSQKLAVNPEKYSAKCWKGCFYGSAVRFVKEYLGCSYIDASTILEDQLPKLQIEAYRRTSTPEGSITLPEGYHPILEGHTPLAKMARRYLKQRDFDMNYLDMIGVGYCDADEYLGYIIIPFKREGELVYYIGRDFMNRGDKWRYKNPPYEQYGIGKGEVIFNEEALYLYDKAYLLEGWADAATIGNNACSLQGMVLSPGQLKVIQDSPVKELVFIADLGAEMEAIKIIEQIYLVKPVTLITLGNFRNLGKDVNEIGADLVLSLERTSPKITDYQSFYDAARSFNTRTSKLLV